MELYMNFVKNYTILSAIIHFAILGTFGEVISKWVINKSMKYPFDGLSTIKKMMIWAFLGVCIKYAFKGFAYGFVPALIENGMLPNVDHDSFLFAFFVSAFMNAQFGLLLVMLHRLLDNFAAGRSNWKNIHKSILSLVWFWIPAHTVTFLLPVEMRVVVAALWSLVLGLILGFFNRK
ncbi:MAG: hypothetical protein B6226_02795 [Candidatus Cloacimonetes bacterium 4572_65]|nr:MAG: hypothetical protein B6226_02795 [Candidatus Cloacimonetes bacterium 4572_65]